MHSFAWWPTLAVLIIATVTDMRSRRVPNWLTLPFLLAGFVVSTLVGGWHGLGQSALGFVAATAVFGFLCWMGGMGMGDVKLFAAIGAWVGPHQLALALVLTAMAGGILALGWAVAGGFLGELATGTGDLIAGWARRGVRPDPAFTLSSPKARKMPYVPAIAIGTLISFFGR